MSTVAQKRKIPSQLTYRFLTWLCILFAVLSFIPIGYFIMKLSDYMYNIPVEWWRTSLCGALGLVFYFGCCLLAIRLNRMRLYYYSELASGKITQIFQPVRYSSGAYLFTAEASGMNHAGEPFKQRIVLTLSQKDTVKVGDAFPLVEK